MTTVKKGAIDQTFYFKLVDSAAGTPETGLTITNIDATYVRNRAAAVKNDLTALGAANSAHADNQGIEVDSTNAPGLYRIDFPDAAFATGADKVILSITCAGCDPAMKEIELIDNVTADVVALLPAALVGGRMDCSVGAMAANTLTAAATAADFTTEVTSGLAQEATLATVAGYLDTEVAAIKAKTDSLPASPAATGAAMTLTAGAVDAILDDVVEGTTTVREMLRGFAAALMGKASGLATTTAVYRDIGDTKDRLTATVDADGNRTAVTLDLT